MRSVLLRIELDEIIFIQICFYLDCIRQLADCCIRVQVGIEIFILQLNRKLFPRPAPRLVEGDGVAGWARKGPLGNVLAQDVEDTTDFCGYGRFLALGGALGGFDHREGLLEWF